VKYESAQAHSTATATCNGCRVVSCRYDIHRVVHWNADLDLDLWPRGRVLVVQLYLGCYTLFSPTTVHQINLDNNNALLLRNWKWQSVECINITLCNHRTSYQA